MELDEERLVSEATHVREARDAPGDCRHCGGRCPSAVRLYRGGFASELRSNPQHVATCTYRCPLKATITVDETVARRLSRASAWAAASQDSG